MKGDALGLLLLVPTLVLAGLGLNEVTAGAARRALLRRRTRLQPEEPRLRTMRRGVERSIHATRLGSRLETRLAASGIDWGAPQFLALAAAIAILAYLVGTVVVSQLIALILAAAAVRALLAWVDHKRGQRRDAFAGQLPELARILSNAASAGLSINAGLEIAVSELEEPSRTELELVLHEVKLGQSLPAALDHMQDRMPSRELGVLASTLVVQQRSGGDLVRALSDISDTLEARKDLIREVRTLMSGQVAVAWVVAVLGIGQVLLVDRISPGVLHKMTTNPIGIAIFVVSGALYTFGFMLILRITKVET